MALILKRRKLAGVIRMLWNPHLSTELKKESRESIDLIEALDSDFYTPLGSDSDHFGTGARNAEEETTWNQGRQECQ